MVGKWRWGESGVPSGSDEGKRGSLLDQKRIQEEMGSTSGATERDVEGRRGTLRGLPRMWPRVKVP